MNLVINVIILCVLTVMREEIDPDIYFILIMFGSFLVGYQLSELLESKDK